MKIIAIFLTLFFLASCDRAEPVRPSVSDFELTPISTLPLLKVDALRSGNITIVNFWASWCTPCRAEHPFLLALAEEPNVTLAGIAYRDPPQNAYRFLQALGNPFALVGLDETGFTALGWGLMGVPETFIVDGEGKILFHHRGPLTGLGEIRKILRAVSPPANRPRAR